MANVREVVKTDELDAINDAVESLQKVSNSVFTKLYENNGSADGANATGDDTVVEDAEIIDDNN